MQQQTEVPKFVLEGMRASAEPPEGFLRHSGCDPGFVSHERFGGGVASNREGMPDRVARNRTIAPHICDNEDSGDGRTKEVSDGMAGLGNFSTASDGMDAPPLRDGAVNVNDEFTAVERRIAKWVYAGILAFSAWVAVRLTWWVYSNPEL